MKKNLPKMLPLLRRMLLLLAWMCMAALAVFYLYSYRGFVVDDMRFERDLGRRHYLGLYCEKKASHQGKC